MLQVHTLDCDVLVAGGGPAGVPAAVAAARNGAKVVLCQDRPMLGGNASSEVRMHIVGADSWRTGRPLEVEAREGGIIEEIRLENAVNNPQRCPSMLDLSLYDLCRREPNLTLLLNTTVVSVEKQGRRITSARAERQSTQDAFAIRAKVFIDCTGDGRLGAEAGASFRRGREGQQEYGESLAQPKPDTYSLGNTLLFQARKYDKPMPFKAPPWARKFTEADLRLRPHAEYGVDLGLEYGYWWCEWGGTLDTIKDNEHIRDELLAIVMGVWDHIKNSGDHGAEHWALTWFGFLPGKRESRRFIGQHLLTEGDVMQSRRHADAIAYGGWPIDTHPPRGIDAIDEHPCEQHPVPFVFDIPLRACVSADVDNLMFAGRNISATHVAFASTRVMATCAAMGQGVGTTAALASRRGKSVHEVHADAALMRDIQQQLLRDDCYLIGVGNEDEHDLACRADRVTADSEQPGGEAANVISGQTRAMHGQRGAPPDRARPGTHRWMSDPAAGLPASLELHWNTPIHPTRVQLIFDTGMSRILTLSHSDAYVEKMQWGRPQAETVRDYHLEALVGSSWRRVADVTGNYQRRRGHEIKPGGAVSALRLTVTATNGLDHARVFEVRVY